MKTHSFALVEAGNVRNKNTLSILIKVFFLNFIIHYALFKSILITMLFDFEKKLGSY